MSVFLITGATGSTGNIGGTTAFALAERARASKRRVTLRLAARTPAKALAALEHIAGGLVTVEAVEFDLTKPETYAKALDGVSAVFLNSPDYEGIDTPERLPAFLDAAAAARGPAGGPDGARAPFVVRLVAAGFGDTGDRIRAAAAEVGNSLVDGHVFATKTIQERRKRGDVDLALVNVQAWFFSNWSTLYTDLVRSGTLALPSADAALPYIDNRDVGEFFAAVLLDRERFAGKDVTVTGSERLTAHDWAAAISRATGREISAVATDEVLAQVLGAQEVMPGVSMWDVMAPFHEWEKKVAGLGLPNDPEGYAAVTGKAHRPLAAFCEQNAALWAVPAAEECK